MSFMTKISTGAAMVALSAGTAVASPTFNFTNVTGLDYQDVWTGFMPFASDLIITQDFAGEATPGRTNGTGPVTHNPAGAWDATTVTNVGTFSPAGGTGAGTSVTGAGDQLQVRSGDNFGRFNPLGNPGVLSDAGLAAQGVTGNTNFLDSNDSRGIFWTISNQALTESFGRAVRSLQAFIIDPNDAGQQLRLSFFVDADVIPVFETQISGSQSDGQVWHFTADNLHLINWTTARIEFQNADINDGIAISNIGVAAIPLPAPILMLLAAIAGLVGVRRLRSKAPA